MEHLVIDYFRYAGIMFATFEFCKRIFVWTNGYTESPWFDKPIPGVPQSVNPEQLRKWYQDKWQKKQ
jgi:solute carrier family 25 protein 43